MKKHAITLIIAAFLVVELTGAVQHFLTRRLAEQEMLSQAQRDIQENQRVAIIKAETETAVRNIMPNVVRVLDNTEIFSTLTAHILKNNPNIVGAGVAFIRDYYKDKGNDGLYAPYSFDDRPASALLAKDKGRPNVHFTNLGFDYTDREWFKKPIIEGKSVWSEPYVDKGGTQILMCSYAAPIIVHGQTIGVFFVDVPLQEISILSEHISSGISRSAIITIIMQLFCLLVLGYIIWRAVSASRHYKETHFDTEKDHLAEQLTKLREVNSRLTKRNQELAEKNVELQRQLQSGYKTTSTGSAHYV